MNANDPEVVDITGLDSAKVIQALYAAARPLGMRHHHFVPGELPYGEAKALVGKHIDYLKGRVMKVFIFIEGKTFDPWLYDRDNGKGAAAKVVARLRTAAEVSA